MKAVSDAAACSKVQSHETLVTADINPGIGPRPFLELAQVKAQDNTRSGLSRADRDVKSADCQAHERGE